jgi:hypothetical protein
MQHLERDPADGDLVAFLEPPVRRDIAAAHDAVRPPRLGEAIEQEGVSPMRSLDRHPELLLERGGPAGVIDVAVREQDLLDRDARLRDPLLDAVEVAAGIDDSAPLRRLAPNDGAVLLERRHRDDHGA